MPNFPFLSKEQNKNFNNKKPNYLTQDNQFNFTSQDNPPNAFKDSNIVNEYEEDPCCLNQNTIDYSEEKIKATIFEDFKYPEINNSPLKPFPPFINNTNGMTEKNTSKINIKKGDTIINMKEPPVKNTIETKIKIEGKKSNTKNESEKNISEKKTGEGGKRPKYMQPHYMRVKFRRNFFNVHVLKTLRKKLKCLRKLRKLKRFSDLYCDFEKLGTDFVICVQKKANKDLFDKTLRDILADEKSYLNKSKKEKENVNGNDKYKYERNKLTLKIIKESGEGGLNKELNSYLDMTYRELLENYIENDFQVEEIERLRKSKNKRENNEDYIKKYMDIGKNFPNYCCGINN